MIEPVFNEETFEKAVGSVKPSLTPGKLEYAILGAWQNGKEMKRYLGPDGKDAPGIKGKLIMLASISKAITGTAVARIVDKGLLSWSDPLSKYLGDMRGLPDIEKIKVEDVFLHLTGFVNIDRFNLGPVPPYEAYKTMLKNGLAIKPGTAFMYITTSYWFINALVHKILGFGSMDDFLKEWIFKPCGMSGTTFHPDLAQTVECHYRQGTELQEYMRLEIPGSGLWSNIDELLKFGRAVITPGKLMSDKTFRMMTEGIPMQKHNEPGFACRTRGWVKEINFNHQPLTGFFHGGATGGVLWCDPGNSFVVVFMSNKWGTDNSDAFRAIGTFYTPAR